MCGTHIGHFLRGFAFASKKQPKWLPKSSPNPSQIKQNWYQKTDQNTVLEKFNFRAKMPPENRAKNLPKRLPTVGRIDFGGHLDPNLPNWPKRYQNRTKTTPKWTKTNRIWSQNELKMKSKSTLKPPWTCHTQAAHSTTPCLGSAAEGAAHKYLNL